MTSPLGTLDGSGDPVALDLDRLVGSHACVVANSGGGKSGLLRRLLETTHGRVQHIVLDVEDEFYTLRERFDYVIAGGEGGDAPASVGAAPGLALAALRHGFSLVVQLNDLGPDGAPDFVGRFLEALVGAPRDLWRPLLIVLDEAQRFAPQEGSTAATAGVRMLTAQGRKRGYTALLASQRLAKIDANVRGDVNNWFLGRVGQSLDRRAVADALGFAPSSAEARGLQGMADRHFWGFGPAIAREPVLFRVADVETTPVRPGQAKIPTPPPPEALREILSSLATPAPIALEGNGLAAPSITERDARIAGLERQLTAAKASAAFFRRRAELSDNAIVAIIAQLQAVLNRDQSDDAAARPNLAAKVSAFATAAKSPAGATIRVGGPPAAAPAAAPTTAGRGSKALAVLARIHPTSLSEAQWAALAGYARTGGTWGTYKGALRAGGLIEHEGGRWRATAAGLAAAGVTPEPLPPPGPDLARFWGARVPGARRLVDTLLKRWPHAVTRDALAADLGMAAGGGTFGTYLGRLRSHGLLEETGRRLRLHPDVMGEPEWT